MLSLSWRQVGLAVGLLAVVTLPALAQRPQSDNDSPINFQGILAPKPVKPVAPEVRAPPMAWPRLERGSILCRTEGDLQRRAAALRGEPTGPTDCRVIGMATAISIVQRHGPGSTEVKITGGSNEIGWTNVYLPPNPPPGALISTGR